MALSPKSSTPLSTRRSCWSQPHCRSGRNSTWTTSCGRPRSVALAETRARDCGAPGRCRLKVAGRLPGIDLTLRHCLHQPRPNPGMGREVVVPLAGSGMTSSSGRARPADRWCQPVNANLDSPSPSLHACSPSMGSHAYQPLARKELIRRVGTPAPRKSFPCNGWRRTMGN